MVAGEWKPGIMHAAIFLGFCALLVRKLHLIVIGYDPLAVIPGAAGAAYAAFKDFVEVAVLAAVAYAFWRRFVAEAPAPGAQPRGDPHPLADPRRSSSRTSSSTASAS